MSIDSRSRHISTASSNRRYHLRSDPCFGGHDESDVLDGDRSKVEYLCPFCAEDFDIFGLYCHVDEEHPVEVENVVCPICGKRDELDIFGHIITQHGNLYKVHRKRRLRKGGSSMTISMLRKELRDGTLQSLLSGTRGTSNPFSEPDSLLSSFIFSPTVEASVNVEPKTADEASLLKDSSAEEILERDTYKSLLPGEDEEERAQKCKFVQGLFFSTFLGDDMSSKQFKSILGSKGEYLMCLGEVNLSRSAISQDRSAAFENLFLVTSRFGKISLD